MSKEIQNPNGFSAFIQCPSNRKRKAEFYRVWIEKLLLIVSSLFEYENLPANLPQWELEWRLILYGRAVVFKSPDYGIVTSFGYTTGFDIYNNANQFGYAQAVMGSASDLVNLQDGVIIYGTSLDKVLVGVVGRRIKYYADLLSELDVSRIVGLINNRAVNSVTAKSDNALNQLNTFYQRVQDGDIYVPKIDSGVLDSTENILKGSNQAVSGYGLQDIDLSQQNLLKRFYQDFGISYGFEKAERLIVPEVTADEKMLQVSIDDMLQCRQTGVNSINNLYGTSIKVGVKRKCY